MQESRSWTAPSIAFVGAIVVGLVLRALTALGGHLYDESVYYAAAALLVDGTMPYRDFVFLHPPGILLVFAPVAWFGHVVGHAAGVTAVSWMSVATGTVNVAMVRHLVRQIGSERGALVAAWLYATFPAAVWAESQGIMEPYVVVLCLSAMALWASDHGHTASVTATRAALVGAVLGLAISVKLWAGIVLLALLVAGRHRRPVVGRLLLAAAGGMTSLAVLGTFATAATWPVTLTQFIGVQLRRPADGYVDTSERLTEMFGYGPVVSRIMPVYAAWLLAGAIAVILLTALARAGNAVRVWSLICLTTMVVLLSSPTFWPHYAAFLAMSLTVVAGLLHDAAVAAAPGRRYHPTLIAGLAMVTVVVGSVAQSAPLAVGGVRSALARSSSVDAATLVGADECLYALNPSVGLTFGRLPTVQGEDARILVDTYGDLLYTYVTNRSGAVTTREAFRTSPPRSRLRHAFGACDYIAAPSTDSILVSGDHRFLYRCLHPVAQARPDTLFKRGECTPRTGHQSL